MQPLGMFMFGVLGLFCIYAGYQLFCDLPSVNPGSPRSRGRVLLVNIVPGALLGLTGMGILTAELRVAISERPAVEKRQGPSGDRSGHRVRAGLTAHVA